MNIHDDNIHENDDFEKELRGALRHEPAPPDFAAKVLARAAGLPRTPKVIPIPLWRKPVAWAIAAGLLVSLAIPPAILEQRHREELRAAEAQRQLYLALSITRAKLNKTKERIQRTTRHTL